MSRVLMVYNEPTPYLLGLIKNLHECWPGTIDIFFLYENLSQHWDVELPGKCAVLPKNWFARMRFFCTLLIKQRYDFIHLAGWGEPLMHFFILIGKLTGTPLSVESDTPFLPHKKSLKSVLKQLIYPVLFKQFKLFLPGGTKQAKYFEYYGVNPTKIYPVQMTVDTNNIKKYASILTAENRQQFRQQYSLHDHDVVFLFVGRLVQHKGLKDLIEIFNRTSQAARLLIIGEGPMRDEVEQAAKINPKIIYGGRLAEKKLIDIYFAADILVLPSHAEPWGLVINEAMSLGLPIIASDRVGCIDDLVKHHENGIIVKAGCKKDLQEAIEYLTTAKNERVAMGTQSAKKITYWTLEQEAKNICQAWYQLVRQ